jgi:hypothetical protein
MKGYEEKAKAVGALLIRAKKLCGHGEFRLPWSDLLEGWGLDIGLLVVFRTWLTLEEIRLADRRELREAIRQLWIRGIYDTRIGYEHPWEEDRPRATKDALLAMVEKARRVRETLEAEAVRAEVTEKDLAPVEG